MATWQQEKRKLDLKMCRIIPATDVYAMLELAEKLLKPGQTHEFVIENFRIDDRDERRGYPKYGKSRNAGQMYQWSEMQTIRQIGALEYAAFRMNNSPVTFQEPGVVLGAAKRWAPFPWPKGHLPDDKSAYCHLFYWASKRNMVDTTDDILQNGQEKLW
jgi:hypothetical protein